MLVSEIVAGLLAIYHAYEELRPLVTSLLAKLKSEDPVKFERVEEIFAAGLATELQQNYLDANIERARLAALPPEYR